MTVHDGGILQTSSFCDGPWNTPPAAGLRHRLLRRTPMAVALDVRVATSRQQQPQPIAQQRRRLRAHVAPHPDWHVAAAPISRDDGSRGATRKRPGLERRDRAALAAVAGVGITAPDRVARPSVQPMLVVDARTQRGWRVAGVERPMDDHPHDPLLLQRRGAVAEYAR